MSRPTNYSPSTYKHYCAPYSRDDIDCDEAELFAREMTEEIYRRVAWKLFLRTLARVGFVIGVLLGAGVIALLFHGCAAFSWIIGTGNP